MAAAQKGAENNNSEVTNFENTSTTVNKDVAGKTENHRKDGFKGGSSRPRSGNRADSTGRNGSRTGANKGRSEGDNSRNTEVKKPSTRGTRTKVAKDLKSEYGIRIALKAYEKEVLDSALDVLVRTLNTTGAVVKSLIRLPTRRKLFVVNRGPHIDKKSREQFQQSVHKVVVNIEPKAQTMEALRALVLPYAVSVRLN